MGRETMQLRRDDDRSWRCRIRFEEEVTDAIEQAAAAAGYANPVDWVRDAVILRLRGAEVEIG